MNEDIENITELRDYGSTPFKPGEIDAEALRRTLRTKRKVDEQLLLHIHLGDEGVTSITPEEAVTAFNALIESDFYLHVNGDFLRLRPEIRRLLTLAVEAHRKKHPVEPEIIQTLNRALIHAVYPDETVKSRQYERFMVPEMLRMTVTVASLSPVMQKSYEGKLLNISAGGMALLLPEKLPELTYWAIQIALADHSEIETVVQIRHAIPQQDQFVHGFQFVSIPAFLNGQIETFARDYSECEERIKANVPDVCHATCTMFDYCTKPQKRLAA